MSQHENKFPRRDATNEQPPAAKNDVTAVPERAARQQLRRSLADVAGNTSELEYERMCARFANTLA